MPGYRPVFLNGFMRRVCSRPISCRPAHRDSAANLFFARAYFWRAFWFVLLWMGEQLHFKNKCRAGADVRASAAIAVTQLRGNKELPLRSYRHQQEGFRPTLDDSIDRK